MQLAGDQPPAGDTGGVCQGCCGQQSFDHGLRASTNSQRWTVHTQTDTHHGGHRMQRCLRHDARRDGYAAACGVLRKRLAARDASCLAGGGDHSVVAYVGFATGCHCLLNRPHGHHGLLVGVAEEAFWERRTPRRIGSGPQRLDVSERDRA